MTSIILLTILSCLQWGLVTNQNDDSFVPPCDNSNINVQQCKEKHDNFIKSFFVGSNFPKLMATFHHLAAPPYKNCSIDVAPGKVSFLRSRDYCQWLSKDVNGKQQKNVFLLYEDSLVSYSCDYDFTGINIANGLQSILKSNVSSISITSCNMVGVVKDFELDSPENLTRCMEGQTGLLERGTIGGSFRKLPIVVQYHIVDKKLTIDKFRISTDFLGNSSRSCEGDEGFKAICSCFQSSKVYDMAAKALVSTLLQCASNNPVIIRHFENVVCTDD